MSITSTTNKQVYDGDGGTVAFAWSQQLRSESDIEVVEYTETTGAEVVQVLNTDYTVALADDLASATVTMNSAPASTVKLILNRKEPHTNNLQFRNHDGLLAENVAEAIDRLAMQSQRLQEQIDRCLKVQIGEDSTNPDITTTTQLPTLTGIDTDGKFLKIASDGDATPVYTLSYESTTTANAITSGGSSTDNAIVRWDGTDGLSVQDSSVLIDDSDNITGANNVSVGGTLGVTGLSTLQSLTLASGATANEISTDGTLAGNSDTAVPTEQAVKTYIDATGSGDFSGPASSTTNAFVRFSDGNGKTGQNSQTLEDVSGNVTVAGDLTVSGNDIYSGSGTINTDFDNNRGDVNLELIAGTNETSRILLQGDNNNTAASTALVMFDENGTANQRTLIFELGQVTNEGSIRLQDDNGGNGRNLITFDMVNESATVTGDATVSGAFTASTGATITTGGLAVSAGDSTFSGDVDTSGNITLNGSTASNRSLYFSIDADPDTAQIQYGQATSELRIGTKTVSGNLDIRSGNNVTALEIDSSQNATFAGDVEVGSNLTLGASGCNKTWSTWLSPNNGIGVGTADIPTLSQHKYATNRRENEIYTFTDTDLKRVYGTANLPEDYDGSQLTVDVYYVGTTTDATTGPGNLAVCQFSHSANAASDDLTLTATHVGVNGNIETPLVADQLEIISYDFTPTGGANAAGQMLCWSWLRNGATGTDNYGGDIELLGIKIYYS